jgi:beta-lactamase regulating signal transducer with metallopeptidase domain/5-hydroxyisourate hydrolase-like protein (transthyretin family)
MNTFLTSLDLMPLRLLRASAQAAVLCLLVLGILYLLRGRLEARWRFALWSLVLARLALLVAPPAPWSLFQWMPAPRNIAAEHLAAAPEHTNASVAPRVEVPLMTEPATTVIFGPNGSAEAAKDAPATPASWSLGQRLAAWWGIGAVLLLARQSWLHAQLHRKRRGWRPAADPALLAVFEGCQKELRITRNIRLSLAEDGSGPATCGIVRPTVVLPDRLPAQISPADLRLVFLHELAHVRRCDLLIDRAATLVAALHWFNPASWVALSGLRREREAACDEAVLRCIGPAESARYGHTLLHVAGCVASPAPLPGAAGVFSNDHSLVRRIRMIASYRKPAWTRIFFGALLVMVMAAFGLTEAVVIASPAVVEPKVNTSSGDDTKSKTLSGICKDVDGKPLTGVEVVLYRNSLRPGSAERLYAITTGTDGHFQFRDLLPLPAEGSAGAWHYGLVIRKTGHGSRVIPYLLPNSTSDAQPYFLGRAATLQGRVTDPSGKPVVGAHVWAQSLASGPVEGVCSTRTDTDGRFAINDMSAWGEDATKPKPGPNGTKVVLSGCAFDVLHPEFAHERPMYRSMPDTVDVRLQPAGVIEGRVVDQVTGRPAAGIAVCLQGISEHQGGPRGGGWETTVTNAAGKYRLTSLIPAKYNLWADAPDRACAALDSIKVDAGTARPVADLQLVEGGWIEGRLVEVETNTPRGKTHDSKPLGSKPGRRLRVASYGPGHPKSGAACQSSEVDERGHFRLRVAPGVNFPYIMQLGIWERTQKREYYQQGIEVKAGEVAVLEFRILPTKPPAELIPNPVRLAVPVAGEREAAAQVRKLGGWYTLDADGHVVEVNMVYHETDKRRFDNKLTETDQALRAAAAFSRLKQLYLTEGQATDEVLQCIVGLLNLEVVCIWDARLVTDAGVAQLAGMGKLTDLHFSNGQLGDGSLKIFGSLPKLRSLSLQGNSFSDDGLRHLSGLKQLNSLWIGMNHKKITDAGIRHLMPLHQLKELDLQGAQLSKELFDELKQKHPGLKLFHQLENAGR